MARRILISAFFVGALALGGCTPTYPKCETDEHCKEHSEVCINGACQECGQDTDCKAGFVCRETKCTPKPECAATADCGAGMKCQGEKCVPECSAATDCADGMRCKAGRCAPPAECVSDADCASGKRCDDDKCIEDTSSASACALQTVRFDFNEFSLTSEARRTLDANLECLRKGKGGAVTLTGHADERGTEEYNLHLGEKRANAVKKYLSTMGIEGGKLRTVSYGEERPSNSGHDDNAWSENRRVELAE